MTRDPGPRRSGPREGRPGRQGRSGRPGRQRPPRQQNRPTPGPDPARRAALETLQAVTERDAYANLELPRLLREYEIGGRDAALATELSYGTLRFRGRYDAILTQCVSQRSLASLDSAVLDVLRLGAHQLLATRIAPHAAVSQTVALARRYAGHRTTGFVNAVLRRVAEQPLAEWLEAIAADAGEDATERLARTASHPPWIVRALRTALVAHGRPAGELEELLASHNTPPAVTLVARPGRIDAEALAAQATAHGLDAGTEPGRWAPTALRLAGGDPAALPAVRQGRAAVQDEGSQLVALALAHAPLEGAGKGAGEGTGEGAQRWLDLCAGPGGKAGLLGALAKEQGHHLVANDVSAHRASLVRRTTRGLDVEVRVGDGREAGESEPGAYDRVLVDAPCTGLGALRRRPEARWRRKPDDVPDLTRLQRELLGSALRAVRPGGIVAYATCSPHAAETLAVVEDVAAATGAEFLDAPAALQEVAAASLPHIGEGPTAQLWPHLHGTDAMFLALLRAPAAS
ncbi:MAG TPA: transcription antitermination factor NusB [Actinomycetaceae bacterium]|nr:transcription antitermination factor NusB [Actinomycetaceae bacterium]